ncbi:MAG: primosomal protein N' [Desulfuromonadales bacterium]|nr:primosomal protein N' [Desulfuromonadales bacterium]
MSELIADIAVNVPLKQLFSYLVPESMAREVRVGMRAKIPFGRRTTVGTILSLREGGAENLKALCELVDPELSLPESLIQLLRWAADYYCHPIGQVVKSALPADHGDDKGRTKILTEKFYSCLKDEPVPRGQKQRKILHYVAVQGAVSRSQLRGEFAAPASTLSRLVEEGYLKEEQKEQIRDPFETVDIPKDQCLTLNDEQKSAVNEISLALDNNLFRSFLLHGVTGSGKTETYLKAVEYCLASHRQALILVPEISLTPQLVARFRARFVAQGRKIAVLHSGLSAGERFDAWREILRGHISIVIGARSAIFAPLDKLGLIIVDEEHDSSYKQGEGFRYNARDLALVRGQQLKSVVVLGSATPSFASFYRSEEKGMKRLELNHRVHAGALPEVQLIDLREQLTEGALSNVLIAEIQQALEQKSQIMLLLNRRGYAPFLLCADCGESFHCPNCSISLTFHQHRKQLRCHYCDYFETVPEQCHKCQSLNIETQGAGTERLEEELAELFPTARIARMDRDSTGRKGAHQRLSDAMLERKIDILVGTQMVAKGHDFPGVALVGVLNADSALNIPDFRSAERSFALLTQVAGRAGRTGGGKVFIQTYNPEHYALICAVSQDYQAFYRQEFPFRRELGYPPCGFLANLVLSGHDLDQVQNAAQRLSFYLSGLENAVQVLGPSPCPLARLRGRNRYQILLKSSDRPALRRLLLHLDEGCRKIPKQVAVQVDIDPLEMM